jgi:FkbH-like protein
MLSNLAWLCAPPADFNAQLDALKAGFSSWSPSELSRRLLTFSTVAFDDNQLNKASRLAGALIRAKVAPEGFTQLKLGLLGDSTLSILSPSIVGSGLRHRLMLEIVEANYNNALSEALDTGSHLHTAGLDMALVVSDARVLGLDRAASSKDDALAKVDAAFNKTKLIVDSLRPSVASAIFVQTLAPPLESLFGSFDRVEAVTPYSMVMALNKRIAEWAATGEIVLIDIARLAFSVGLENWDEPRHWHASKLGFSPVMLPVYGDVVARTVACVRGLSRKCLVLDLDNTLWGGVIGDDGVGGIVLGQGSGTGEAFVAIQRLALELRARGIVLAVCSKNEEDAARLPFREHPDMVLREDHIAVFQANWTDKAANLRLIAEKLNIGVDALVFLDDNPAERMQVRGELPQVAVPEIPEDPALYPRILAAAGYFEAVAFSAEDRERAAYYQANAERAAALSASGDIGGYLHSLGMVCTFGPVDATTRPRATQLIGKSNQFNLTTRRYSEAEVAAAASDPARHIVQVRLVDRFGDNGIIAVLIADKAGESWEIDTWLMSCRVLGRRVEEACLQHLAVAAKREGARELIGRYTPTAKNKMVANHYRKLGFAPLDETPDGGSTWRLDLAGFQPQPLEMRVEDQFNVLESMTP